MAEINDFLPADAHKINENMKKAYDNGFHFEWIGQSNMFLETMMKVYLHVHFQSLSPNGLRKEQVEWIRRIRFFDALNFAEISGLLSDKLYADLNKVNKARNNLLHGLIIENEKLKPLELESHFKLCQETNELLIVELLSHMKLQIEISKATHEALKEIKEKQTGLDNVPTEQGKN